MKRFGLRRCSLVALSALAAHAAFAATITVNSTLDVIDVDDGLCTLREAITAANLNLASGGVAGECAAGEVLPAIDSIVFNIAGAGTQTITVATLQLPGITQAVTIDGANGGVAGNLVQISGGGLFATGLSFEFTGNVTVRNLVVNGFTGRQFFFLDTTLTPTLDFDDDGQYRALTDGLLLIRHLFSLDGPALTTSALGPNAQRTEPEDIAAYIESIRPALDVDLNGVVTPLTDGLMVIRYLFGLRGERVLALGANSQRNTVQAIQDYIASLMP